MLPLECGTGPLLKDAILAAVGVLNGSRFNGGSRSGFKCFFFAGTPCPFISASEPAPGLILAVNPEPTFLRSLPDEVPDSSLVELLFLLLMLLASN